MGKPKWRTVGNKKLFAIIDKGRVVSRHKDFYLAQKNVERLLGQNKLSSNYQIVSLETFKK